MSPLALAQLEGDPHSSLARLRESEPVAWLDDLGGWLVTSHSLCLEVLTDADTYTVDDERFSTRRVVGPSMLSLDGPEHRRHRAYFAPALRSQPVRELLERWVVEKATSLVGAIAGAGRGDLRSAVASPLATMVMRRLLGLDDVDIDDVIAWNEAITSAIDEVTAGKEVPANGLVAFEEMRSTVKLRSSSTGLLARARRHGGLDVDEITANVAVLLIGGIVTSDGAISIVLRHLLDRPGLLEQLIEEPDLIADAVEESMRLEPAAAFLDRYATRDVGLGSASIEAGDLVRVSISAANRDPGVFEDPDVFDLRRNGLEDHLSFARGPHACLGFHVARLEARSALRAILAGLPGLRAAPGETPQPSGLIFRAPRTVPALWGGKSKHLS